MTNETEYEKNKAKLENDLERYNVINEYYSIYPERVLDNEAVLTEIVNKTRKIGQEYPELEKVSQRLSIDISNKIKVQELISKNSRKEINKNLVLQERYVSNKFYSPCECLN